MILFSLIVIFIIYVVFLIGYFLLPRRWRSKYIKHMSRLLVSVLGFTKVNIDAKDLKRYSELLRSDHKFLIVANHRSIFDHFIFLSLLENISFLANIGGLIIPGLRTVVEALNGIIVMRSKDNTTQKIIDNVRDREPNGNVLIVYPDGMADVPIGKCIAPFKSGAFVGRFDILPIVIKYKNYDIDPFYYYSKGETMVYAFFRKLLGTRCDVDIRIMPLQRCAEKMSIEDYKNKIYRLMSKEYKRM